MAACRMSESQCWAYLGFSGVRDSKHTLLLASGEKPSLQQHTVLLYQRHRRGGAVRTL